MQIRKAFPHNTRVVWERYMSFRLSACKSFFVDEASIIRFEVRFPQKEFSPSEKFKSKLIYGAAS